MNKDKLIREVAKRTNNLNKEVKSIVETTFNTIIERLENGEEVQIVGFGAFQVRKRASRKGRNPQTGSSIQIPETVTPAFTPGKVLRDTVKGRN